jgi:hypothetical protein
LSKRAKTRRGAKVADTLSHATQGSLLLLSPFIARIRERSWLWVLVAAGAFFGALPDLIGAYGNLIEHDHWALYRSAHQGEIKEILQYIPMYWIHLRIDALLHGQGHRWWVWSERFWAEIALWLLNILLIFWFARIFRNNRKRASSPHRVPSGRGTAGSSFQPGP